MGQAPVLFFAIFAIILTLVLGGVYPEPIIKVINRRVPSFSYQGEVFLLWGLFIVTAFAFGLIVMYLLLTT